MNRRSKHTKNKDMPAELFTKVDTNEKFAISFAGNEVPVPKDDTFWKCFYFLYYIVQEVVLRFCTINFSLPMHRFHYVDKGGDKQEMQYFCKSQESKDLVIILSGGFLLLNAACIQKLVSDMHAKLKTSSRPV